MATRKGQAVQTTWTYKEKGALKGLKDILDGCLSKGKLLEVLQGHEPQEVYALLSRLLDSKGNGGTPRTLESLVSKAKKLAYGSRRRSWGRSRRRRTLPSMWPCLRRG